MRDPDWKQVSTGAVEQDGETLECAVYQSTPDSECCEEPLDIESGDLICTGCGEKRGEAGYGEPPERDGEPGRPVGGLFGAYEEDSDE